MGKIEDKFWAFHMEHPVVYIDLRELALRLKRRGRKHYGIGALFEVLRYERALAVKDDDGFKLNNNYRALYARLLMALEPELSGFFETRIRRSNPERNV